MPISIFNSNFCLRLHAIVVGYIDVVWFRYSVGIFKLIHTYSQTHIHIYTNSYKNDRESCVEEPNYSPHIYEKGGAKSTITWILKTN